MVLILLRHTRPAAAEGLCYGRTDLPLAKCFTEAAATLARDLPPFRRILTSPLLRCRLLARTLATARAVPLSVDPRLVEMDFGTWEGRRWSELPRAELDVWAADLLDACPHGGERVAELAERTAHALTEARQGPVPALLVTHAGVIKAALAAQEGPSGWEAEIAFGTWRVFGGEGMR